MGSMIVHNKSNSAVSCFVSKWTSDGGNESWFPLGANCRDSWSRNGWETVGFKNENDTKRAGIYVPINSTVIFYSFDNIKVE